MSQQVQDISVQQIITDYFENITKNSPNIESIDPELLADGKRVRCIINIIDEEPTVEEPKKTKGKPGPKPKVK